MSRRVLSPRNARGLHWAAIFGLCVLLLTAYTAIGAAQAGGPKHATLRVPGQYPTIQSAVNAAHAGDTILVGPGTYTEQVTVDTSVNIVGAGAGRSFIADPGATSYLVVIGNAATVSLSGFTITTATPSADAILVFDGATASIFSNTIWTTANGGTGIEVSYYTLGPGTATITGNQILTTAGAEGNEIGVVVFGGAQAVVTHNTILGPGLEGVILFGGTGVVTSNLIGNFQCGFQTVFGPCGPDWAADIQGGGVVDYFDPGLGTVISNNVVFSSDEGVQLAAGAPGIVVSGNLILNSVNYGLAGFDGTYAFSHDTVIGAPYGLGAAATFTVTTETLDHVLIIGASVAPFYYEADNGQPVPTVGGTYTVF